MWSIHRILTILVTMTLVVGAVGASPLAAATATTQTTETPWLLATDLTVEKDGTVEVTMRVNKSVGKVYLNAHSATDFTVVSGGDAVEADSAGRDMIWDTDAAREITYSVEIGDARYGSAVLDRAVIFRTSELAYPGYWQAATAPVHRVSITAPDGWSVAAPGTEVAENTYVLESKYPNERTRLREMLAVGEFDVHEWTTDGGHTIRYAAFPGADAPDRADLKELLVETTPVLQELTGVTPAHPTLAMTVPESIENGGVARDHSFIVQGNLPTFNVENGRSTYVHEYVHLHQPIYGARGSDWISEGMASYYQHLALREAGLISTAEFKRMVRADVTSRQGIGDPVASTAGGSKYSKGEAVFAALDMDIRNRTDGEKTIADFAARLHQQTMDSEERLYVTRSEFLAALSATTGHDYSSFYDTYIDGAAFPQELLSETYSLEEPVRIEAIASKAVLRSQIRELETTVEEKNERIAEQNETIADLEDRLAAKDDRVEELEERLAEKNETIAELRAQANESESTAATAQSADNGGDNQTGTSADIRVVPLLLATAVVFGAGFRLGRR